MQLVNIWRPPVYTAVLFSSLSQIDTWCKENKYVIAGYYQANERTKESR